MSAVIDPITGKLARCAVTRFVAKGANEQCLNGPHDLAKTQCRFASDDLSVETHAPCLVEMNRLQLERDTARRDLDLSTRALERITKAHEAARKELGDARKGEAVLRECLRNLLASAVHEAMEGDGVSEEMEPHVKAAQKALAGEIPAGAT